MNFIYPFLLLTAALAAKETAPQEKAMPMPMLQGSSQERSLLTIDPKNRAQDYVQAYELLRKDKPALKISIRTLGGETLSNVTDLSVSEHGTLLFVKVPTNQGARLLVLPLEEILEIAYSSS